MTSNTGSHIIQNELQQLTDKNRDEIIEQTQLKVFELLKQSIKPEFLNRIDEVIMFTPLLLDDIQKIVKLQFKYMQKQLLKNQVELSISDEAISWLAVKGYDPSFGARPIKRLIQKTIMNDLSKAILAEKVKANDKIKIELENDSIVFKN